MAMYEDIIDINEAQIPSVLYSRISFVAGILNMSIVILSMLSVRYAHVYWIMRLTSSALVLICCFSAIGLLATFISFKIKERSSFYKWSGVVINVCIVFGVVFLLYA